MIQKPLITEKGLSVKETEGTLVFAVAPQATKTEVKQAVETLFKVKVATVRTSNAVSYTHLDVYKRQKLDLPAGVDVEIKAFEK